MKKDEKNIVSAIRREAYELTETILICIFVVSLIFTYLLRMATVDGDSMLDTFVSGDRVIAAHFHQSLKTGDVILVYADNAFLLNDKGETVKSDGLDKQIIKRVIAAEGQTIDIDFVSGHVFVDGQQLSEDYIKGLTHKDSGAFTEQYPLTVPQGFVFVLGDNRQVSMDSRSGDVGLVSEDEIMGKVFLRYYPFNRFSFIK